MLHWFAGELFVFELTPWQEESLRVADGSWNTVFKEMPDVFNTKGLPVVSLENVTIDDAPSLKWGQRITGHISYDTEAHCFFRHAVQLDYDFLDGPRGTAWSYPDSWFLTKGKLSFSFPPIFDCDALRNVAGPQTVTLFLRLCTVPSPREENRSNGHPTFVQTREAGSSPSVHRLHNPPGNPYKSLHPIVSNTRAVLAHVDPPK
ncbi:MAG: hypothetical protein WD490_03810 [Opitutales bacterium]